ncbi:hypothetical protein DDZ13_13660 [Coraliomargarita sinensis]|uniref:Glycosyltransferase 2-like domain-containing protein n=1 Tax=Coraliomargarita sinensis TaxID=2174842 RepID=A0A317ZH40_9BACT|nr:glycosyltransferase [Coraliomargarita sinensis]PXA03109.1 hypothetical protein DDZ13_13660 [Coraliomargarita sinensis]
MHQNDYKLTVIISTYSDRELVSKKLDEITGQSAFDSCEFIFIDACSPEHEHELLQPFCSKHLNCRIIRSDERISLYQAWNIGWKEARAPYVCVSNMDDMMHPKLLETVIREVGMGSWDVLSVLIARQERDSNWNSWDQKRLSRLDLNTRPGAYFAWRKDLNSVLGMFDENLVLIGDKDFWARIRDHRLRIRLIPKLLYLYTKHEQQLSKKEEFRHLKASERKLCSQKPYPHEWPRRFQWKARLCRSLPFKYIYEPA